VAAHLGLPLLSYATRIEPDEPAGSVRVRRISATGYDLLEARMPAVISCTQALGEPRYPSLKGIMGARSKEIVTRSLGDIGLDPSSVGGGVATTQVLGSTVPPRRGATEVVRGTAQEGAARIIELLTQRRII
jgi:electron transfer flavoprotein beta subunit